MANAREAIDDHATTWNDVAGDAENAVTVREPFNQCQLTAQAIVGAFESSHVCRRVRDPPGSLEQAAKSVQEGAKHPSFYASPH